MALSRQMFITQRFYVFVENCLVQCRYIRPARHRSCLNSDMLSRTCSPRVSLHPRLSASSLDMLHPLLLHNAIIRKNSHQLQNKADTSQALVYGLRGRRGPHNHT